MKYLAFGYDGNQYLIKSFEAEGPVQAVEESELLKLFGPGGAVMLLIETPARVHYIDADGVLTTRGSD